MAEFGAEKVEDENNDSIKLNGVPGDTNIDFGGRNESNRIEEQRSSEYLCTSRKYVGANEINNIDKLHESNAVIDKAASSALANGHLRIDQALLEHNSVLDRQVQSSAELANARVSEKLDCSMNRDNAKEKETETNNGERRDSPTCSHSEESDSNSHIGHSSRNANAIADDDDIEEVTPTDPLADDYKSKLRNKTIVVSDTKGLVEFATNARVSKCNKKEPTLVIIDTKSILSGRGPVPVSHSSGGTSLLHSTAGSSTPIPVSLPISASALTNSSRAISAGSTSAFSVIPIGLPTQGLYPQYKTPPPQMKPIVVGPASTTVTPISLQTTLPPSATNIGSSSIAASVSVTTSGKQQQQQQPPVVLPSLTDDMFVVEAPSFIVPYVYEKPPMKALKEHLEKIETEIKEAEAQRKQEKEAREKESATIRLLNETEEADGEEKEDEEACANTEAEEGEDETEKVKGEVKCPANDREEGVASDDEKTMKIDEKTEDRTTTQEMDEAELTSVEKSRVTPSVQSTAEMAEINSRESEVTSANSTSSAVLLSDEGKGIDQVAVALAAEKKEDVAACDKKEAQQTLSTTKDDKKSTNAADDSKKPLSFFDNPLGKFFIQIGLNLVQEHVQTDLLRSQKRKRDKEGENCSPEVHATISELTRTLESSKENNDPFKLDTKKCELCSFRTESLLVMAHHLETPHMKNYTYRCNFCPLEVRSPHDILFHMEAEHNVRGRLERAPAFHQCPNCPFEDNQKGKLTRHMVSCSKKYRPEKNQEPPLDWEPPAKIPRVTRNRPPSMSPGNAVYQAAMSGLKQVPQNTLLPKLMPNSTTLKHNMMNTNKRSSTVNAGAFVGRFPSASSQSNFQQRPISVQNTNQGLLYRTPQQGLAAVKLLNQPSISITPLPRQNPVPQQSSSSNNAVINSTGSAKTGKPASTMSAAVAAASNNKNSFVVCEICDGYIKDLEQLRNHMQWIHKVKIHPKMIYNRPPLNCQKCQFRFFTDQGLERHLLGSHGLVTSSMQEAANKGKDGGRCPVCGRVYQWKLLNHVARDHQMALKPAHLSYKCTVCTATFGMYKQFESHVYSAHSMVAKRAMDPKKPSLAPSSSSQSDALLKPLKINDEITIIPQPIRSTKPMNKITSNVSNIVNSRNKDGCDQEYCGSVCVSRDFSTVEEFKRHLLSRHVKPFSIRIARLDDEKTCVRRTNKKEGRQSSYAHSACRSSFNIDDDFLREKHKLKPFCIRLTNLSGVRENCVYKVVLGRRSGGVEDEMEMELFVPQIELTIESNSLENNLDRVALSAHPFRTSNTSYNDCEPTSVVPIDVATTYSSMEKTIAERYLAAYDGHFLSSYSRKRTPQSRLPKNASKARKLSGKNSSVRGQPSVERFVSSCVAAGVKRGPQPPPFSNVIRQNVVPTKTTTSSTSLYELQAAPLSANRIPSMFSSTRPPPRLCGPPLRNSLVAAPFAVSNSRPFVRASQRFPFNTVPAPKSASTAYCFQRISSLDADVINLLSDSDDSPLDEDEIQVVQPQREPETLEEYILPV